LLVIQYIVNVEKSKHIAKKVNLSTFTTDAWKKYSKKNKVNWCGKAYGI